MTPFDPKRAHPSLHQPEVVDAIDATVPTLLGDCDQCAEIHIERPATCERRVGQVWASVCEAHAYRIDSAARRGALRGAL